MVSSNRPSVVMEKEALINNFAVRCFRNVADADYISARMSYRAELFSQFMWSGLQAFEKYFKAILLLNRIPAKDIGHDLAKASKHFKELPFELKISSESQALIDHLDTFGRFRYLESSFYLHGPKLFELDKAVWEVRRYCKVLNYELLLKDGKIRNMLEWEIKAIMDSEKAAPQKFALINGTIEQILKKKDHPARAALIWKNVFFGSSTRQKVQMVVHHYATNAPVTLNPEIIEEVIKYVFLPKEIINIYKN